MVSFQTSVHKRNWASLGAGNAEGYELDASTAANFTGTIRLIEGRQCQSEYADRCRFVKLHDLLFQGGCDQLEQRGEL